LEKSYTWFRKRRRSKVLDLAQEQITKALDTVTLLEKAIKNVSQSKKKEAMQQIENLFKVEKDVDKLRTLVFRELSRGAGIFAESREDLMHLVKRLDTLADHAKDAARCVKMLSEAEIAEELWEKTAHMTSTLVNCASTLRDSIEELMGDSAAAINKAQKVTEIENEIDKEYLQVKSLFIKHGEQMNSGSMVIFDDLVEFIEHAADMCADTADYIVILASME
jgi:predicted phosphate transport protein (TIGR00153 family)